ncbi:MAG: fibronectin type III domain-containing protein [Planctomycetes bacterium]|nr:fibronectin type III domain-containing protein [Planctomycetota bacterium]
MLLAACSHGGVSTSSQDIESMSLTVLAARPSSIEIGWSAPANFSSVCCFQILHDGVVEYQADRADRSATLHGVVPQSRHCFRVRAMSSGFPLMGLFMVAESNTVCVDVPVNSPPTVPQDVEATVLSPARVDLRWSPSTDEEAVAGYRVYEAGSVLADVRTNEALLTDLDPARTYCFEVAAYDDFGAESAHSAPVCVDTPADSMPPSAPSFLRAEFVQGTPNSIHVWWDAAADDGVIRGYEIARDGAPLGMTTTQEWDDAAVAPFTEYRYSLVAVDAGGNRSDPIETRVTTSWRAVVATSHYGWIYETACVLDSVGVLHVVYRMDSFESGQTGWVEQVRHWSSGLGTIIVAEDQFQLESDCGLAIAPDGTLHAAFGTRSSGLAYANDVSGSWQTAAVAGASGRNVSVLVHSSGNPMISFRDDDQVRLAEANPPDWIVEAIGPAGTVTGSSFPTALAEDSTGAVHVAFQSTDASVRHAVRPVAGTWTVEVVDPGPGTFLGESISMIVDSMDHVHLTYYDDRTEALRYASNQTGAWVTSVIDDDGDVGTESSVAIDAAGSIHVSYVSESAEDLKYATNASGAWRTFTVDSASDVSHGGTSIFVDSFGIVRIVYVAGSGEIRIAANDAN